AAPLGEHLGDRRGQRGLAVVDVPHRADVDVRLGPHVRLLRHVPSPELSASGRGETHGSSDPSPWGSPGTSGKGQTRSSTRVARAAVNAPAKAGVQETAYRNTRTTIADRPGAPQRIYRARNGVPDCDRPIRPGDGGAPAR